jgi:hypothetical protein
MAERDPEQENEQEDVADDEPQTVRGAPVCLPTARVHLTP